MEIKKATGVVFSATDSTKHVADTVLSKLGFETKLADITRLADKAPGQFAEDELVLFAVPSFGGRVPAPALAKIAQCKGDGTPAVLLAVYGNRAFDDTLAELQDTVEKGGFQVVAAGAFVAEHSIFHEVAANRPDERDEVFIDSFAQDVRRRLDSVGSVEECGTPEIPGNRPYCKFDGVPFKPAAGDDCVQCGICAGECPVGAIPDDAPNTTKNDVCISCMRCIKRCPNHARSIDGIKFKAAAKVFGQKCKERQEPQFFL